MLPLSRRKKSGAVAGLDIEARSIAAAEVSSNGSMHVAGAVQPLAPGAFQDGEVTDGDLLAESLKAMFAEHKLSKQVRLGVANQRVIVRTMRLPVIEDPKEMATAVRFQAQEQIPMPLDQAVLEHQVVGGVPGEEGSMPKVDVVVVAARRDMVASFLEPVRKAGLEPVGVDLSAFGMIRALVGVAAASAVAEEGANGDASHDGAVRPDQATLYCNVADVTNLAVARSRACLFTRVATVGLEAIAGRLAAERGLNVDHATEWLMHVGLEVEPESIEGDPDVIAATRRTLVNGVTALVDELRLSLDYYGAQENAVPVERIVLCGPASTIPGLAARMQDGLAMPLSVARPDALGGYADEIAARLTLPYGLALES